jgi:hypothetical protein
MNEIVRPRPAALEPLIAELRAALGERVPVARRRSGNKG